MQAHLILSHFTLLCFADIGIFFYKLKVSSNPAWSRSIVAAFPAAFSHFISLCGLSGILAIFPTSRIIISVMMISGQQPLILLL